MASSIAIIPPQQQQQQQQQQPKNRSLFTPEQSRSEEDNDVSMQSEIGTRCNSKDTDEELPQANDTATLHRCNECDHLCEHSCRSPTSSITTTNNNNKTAITTTSNINNNNNNNKTGLAKGHGKTSNEWIKLNVGGTCFQTTRTTLCCDRNTFFYRLIQEDDLLDSQKDENGAYLIDRDPVYFVPILNYLRTGKLILNKDINVEGVLEEAEFYNVTQLIKLLKADTDHYHHSRKNNVETKSHVYRLLHCREEEISLAISTLSDGWKFEQLIPTHPSRSTDYFLIVSREYSNK